MKKCIKCQEYKSLDSFGNYMKDRKRNSCKKCNNEYNKNYRKNNPEKTKQFTENRKEKSKEYRIKNKEKRKDYLNKWKKLNPEKVREQKYRHRHGITIKDYDKMLENQNYMCKICKSLDFGRKNLNYFIVDHCHKTKKVRGLLCHKCNSGLGKFKDNIKNLENAIDYLKNQLEEK